MEILDLPPVRLIRQTVFLRRQCRTAGTSLIGVPHRVGNGIKRWEVGIEIAPDWESPRIKEFEAFVSRLDCSTIIRLPVFDAFGYDAARSPAQQAWSDGTWWNDGYGWVDDNPPVSPIVVTTGAAAGASQLNINVTAPKIPGFHKGDYFSHDGFLYHVIGRTDDGWVRFAPAARRAIPVGATLKTDPAVFYAYPNGDDFGQRGRGLLSIAPSISLNFVEAFDR